MNLADDTLTQHIKEMFECVSDFEARQSEMASNVRATIEQQVNRVAVEVDLLRTYLQQHDRITEEVKVYVALVRKAAGLAAGLTESIHEQDTASAFFTALIQTQRAIDRHPFKVRKEQRSARAA